MPGEDDFLPDEQDSDLASLVTAIFGTEIGKNRKAHLTAEQAVQVARARAFADMYDVPELHTLCDVLMDSTISINGRGMKQLVTILSARMQRQDDENNYDKLRSRLLN